MTEETMPDVEKRNSPTATRSVTGKRVNIILAEKSHSDLVKLSKETMRTMTELIRLGLGLIKIVLEAERMGHRLIVTTSEGQPVKEIVLPG